MNWSESEDYKKLLTECVALGDEGCRNSFELYLANMWETPDSYRTLLQAFLEFSTPKKPTFRKLGPVKPVSAAPKKRRRRRRRRRGGSKKSSS